MEWSILWSGVVLFGLWFVADGCRDEPGRVVAIARDPLTAARVHEESADLLNSSGDVASAMRASEFAATEREAYAALLARHPEWDPDGP